ncbi:MAG: hypothetical protein ACXVKK_10640 [Flavisolibacter sp.]
MSYYFTCVPTAAQYPVSFTHSTTYQISDEITLKPTTRTYYNDPFSSGSALMSRMFFISNATSTEEHIQNLRKWVVFHSFVFWFPFLCDLFERGLLNEHNQVNSIDEIKDSDFSETNEILSDFENVANKIYFYHPPLITVRYKSLYKKYEEFQRKDIDLLETCLFQIRPLPVSYSSYYLFDAKRYYWQIVIYCAVLEEILGHAANCPGSNLTCETCNKRFTHRQGSEKSWRDQVLSGLINDVNVKQQYTRVINAAYDEIRNKTAHPGQLPVPSIVFPTTEREIYDVERAINDFGSDDIALQALHSHVSLVTRYLLLNKLFQLNVFPEIPPLQTIVPGL